jgi:hypothetical protein
VRPTSKTELIRELGNTIWRTNLSLKTHYVYSVTAAECLSDGKENGILFFRSVKTVSNRKGQTVVEFEATPLIIGSGILKL